MEKKVQQRFRRQGTQRSVMEELYRRFLFADNTISRKKKLRILSNMFFDGTPSELTPIHVEVLDHVRCIVENTAQIDVTYHDLHCGVAFRKNHHEHQQN